MSALSAAERKGISSAPAQRMKGKSGRVAGVKVVDGLGSFRARRVLGVCWLSD